MTDTTDTQATDLMSLIATAPYQPGPTPEGVTLTGTESGVQPGGDTPAQSGQDADSSPTVQDVARTGQQAQGTQGVTAQGEQPDGSNADQTNVPDPRDAEIEALRATVEQQSGVVNSATIALQNQQRMQMEALRRGQEAQFQASLQDLPEEERRAKIAERRAFLAEQQLLGTRQQAQRAEAERQQSAKRYLAEQIAGERGLPAVVIGHLMNASDLTHMESLANQALAELQGAGYGREAQQATQSQRMMQQGEQFTQPMTPPQQEIELPSPAFAGVGSTSSATMPKEPEFGSGDLMGLIQARTYTRTQ